MTFLNILLYVALIGYVLFKKIQGRPIRAPRKLLGLPIVLIVLGFGDLTSGPTMKPVEIALTVIGAILSIGLGLMRGQADRITTRDGAPFVHWGKASLMLFGVNIVATDQPTRSSTRERDGGISRPRRRDRTPPEPP